MMGDALAPWHIILLVVVLLVLFGSKKLPGAARSLGESMRIFKAETKGLHDDNAAPASPAATPAQPAFQTPQPAQIYANAPDTAQQQQLRDLQRQVEELQKQNAGAAGAGVNGSMADTPPSQPTF
jgi:sec-independent protein translocase protein TatA